MALSLSNVHADDCEGARNRLSSVLGRLAPDQGSAIELGKVYSYADLLATESSECEVLTWRALVKRRLNGLIARYSSVPIKRRLRIGRYC